MSNLDSMPARDLKMWITPVRYRGIHISGSWETDTDRATQRAGRAQARTGRVLVDGAGAGYPDSQSPCTLRNRGSEPVLVLHRFCTLGVPCDIECRARCHAPRHKRHACPALSPIVSPRHEQRRDGRARGPLRGTRAHHASTAEAADAIPYPEADPVFPGAPRAERAHVRRGSPERPHLPPVQAARRLAAIRGDHRGCQRASTTAVAARCPEAGTTRTGSTRSRRGWRGHSVRLLMRGDMTTHRCAHRSPATSQAHPAATALRRTLMTRPGHAARPAVALAPRLAPAHPLRPVRTAQPNASNLDSTSNAWPRSPVRSPEPPCGTHLGDPAKRLGTVPDTIGSALRSRAPREDIPAFENQASLSVLGVGGRL